MKIRRSRDYLVRGILVLLFMTCQAIAAKNLATDDQLDLEKLALRVAASDEVRSSRERARRQLLADETAATLAGVEGLERALDQWVMGQVVAVINNDPARPRLLWAVDNTPRQWYGHIFPGAAVAIDNPDNVNRTSPLHGNWSYRLKGQFGSPRVGQTSINVTAAPNGQLRMGEAIATLTDRHIVTDETGRFEITLDNTPANGRRNHIQLRDGPMMLSVRDSHSDWRQKPTSLSISVVAGPEAATPVSAAELAVLAAEGLDEFVAYWLNFKNNFWNKPDFNRMNGPLLRKSEGGWGTQAGGRFRIAPDEALVITTLDGGAAYTGFQISDPWTISPTPVYRTTSRNLSQVTANPDGSYTYVVALVDPGVANWIDTAGLHEGWFMLRWQNLPDNVEVEALVTEIKLVKLDELDAVLDEQVPRVDIAARRAEILRRIEEHAVRSAE